MSDNVETCRSDELIQALAARARAERDSRAKDRLLALLVHELRNPLTPIRNAVVILGQKAAADPLLKQTLDHVDRQSLLLARLLEDALDLAHLTRDKVKLHKERVDLTLIIRQSTAALRSHFQARQLTLEIALPAGPVFLEADPARLQRILAGLLGHALKYTTSGGTVRLTAVPEGEGLCLRVVGGGAALSAEELAHFFDLGADESPGGGGPERPGIGLLLAHGLVELHGGTLEARSAGPERELLVRLPGAAGPEAPASVPASVRPRADGRALRILYVEDDPDIAESMSQMLEEMGHQTRVVHSGPEALAAAEAFRPEAVLLDIDLPGMNGLELARRLRAQPGLGGVVLAAVSGYGHDEDRKRSREAGIDYYLVKPVRAADVEQVLKATPP
jgi:CheY-like chemotaxis protein